MPEYVYAVSNCWLMWGPNGTHVKPGDKFRADDPLVKAFPVSFTLTDPRDADLGEKVEQATAAPGERRHRG